MMRQTMAAAQQQSAGGGAFSPDDIATLVVWFDAADETTLSTTGSRVDSWADKSSTGADLGRYGLDVVTGANTQNSLNVLEFGSVGDSALRSTATPWMTSTAGHWTVFAAFNATDATPSGGIVSQDIGTGLLSARCPQFMRTGTEEMQGVNIAGSGAPYTDGAAISDGTWYAGATRQDATTLEAFVAGSTNGGTSSTPGRASSASFVRVCEASGVTSHFVGLIGEIICYQADLTDAEMNDVGNYLASKWALTWSDL
jgi:hypothetical protein